MKNNIENISMLITQGLLSPYSNRSVKAIDRAVHQSQFVQSRVRGFKYALYDTDEYLYDFNL